MLDGTHSMDLKPFEQLNPSNPGPTPLSLSSTAVIGFQTGLPELHFALLGVLNFL
jgi:hypothetical protein